MRTYDTAEHKQKESPRSHVYASNLEALDTPFDRGSFPLKKALEYPPCEAAMNSIKNGLLEKPKLDLVELDENEFEREDWEAYQRDCQKRGAPIKTFMLGRFLKGYSSRLVRLIIDRFPYVNVEVVANHIQASFSKDFEALAEHVRNAKRGDAPIKLMGIKEEDFDREGWNALLANREKAGYSPYPPYWIHQYTRGLAKNISLWISELHKNYTIKHGELDIVQHDDGKIDLYFKPHPIR